VLDGLRLPDATRACLFDMDGVLTDTAQLHVAAWKEAFDAYLTEHDRHPLFDAVSDYDAYVDGKPRYAGAASFLASRHIDLPEGVPSDPPDAETVDGLANRKNEIVLRLIRADGVTAYPGSLVFLRAARDAGLGTAVVSSSANTREVLDAAGIDQLFDVIVDGRVAELEHLKAKPAPDTYLAAARMLGVDSKEAAVFEDALAGVESGRAGGFGYVVGVDRADRVGALFQHGADVVVRDLAELVAPR
jgi:beta-phosphoglucomutase family hydrolase